MLRFSPRLAATTLFSLFGRPAFRQNSDEVLVRDPNFPGRYDDPLSADEFAGKHWEYAVMSENAYQAVRASAAGQPKDRRLDASSGNASTEEAFLSSCSEERKEMPLPGWRAWDFPSQSLQARMIDEGMYFSVLERTDNPHTIAVVFEGTDFRDIRDWKSNLRWFLRFIPGYTDQYLLTAREIATEFQAAITDRSRGFQIDSSGALVSEKGRPVRIVAAGHSLGGGLAQHFAYAFRQDPPNRRGPKVSEVFAFNPSPVTGWFSTPDPPRSYNAEGLLVHRIYEHGEILAFLRLLTSRLAITPENPAIWEYRYNFDKRPGMIHNHAMRSLACGIVLAAEPWKKRKV